MIIRSGNFSLFLLHFFYLHFVLLAESKPALRSFFFLNIREILWFEKSL